MHAVFIIEFTPKESGRIRKNWKSKIEIKIETLYQNKYSSLGLVAYGIENESESIVKSFKNNELV